MAPERVWSFAILHPLMCIVYAQSVELPPADTAHDGVQQKPMCFVYVLLRIIPAHYAPIPTGDALEASGFSRACWSTSGQ
ncbi:hypothetical protein DICSQDRAFT_141357 [Dichomitus squalens LYAD-421 SS1]|uniref:Secreted protein n=1 Tax=Dichomitus squalens (strain LYAD-421) TaxID=732165 RepID=R7SJH8_DICSQ|nr:uncharacterized protein DICSQDRAFT_141357 [Dichomitus squalens LYAD-421 SS1]EJF56311.1 hypothetical protein DICSQDRAFT_141357 [Dichomitus squalens LYAD-421 SS1]